MPSFEITAATQNLKTDASGHTQAVFTVTNRSQGTKRALAGAKAVGDTKREWLSIEGNSDRDIAGAGGFETFNINFNAPNASPGKYTFRLDVAAYNNPDEDRTEGPAVTVEVSAAPPPPPPPPFPKWIFLVIAAIVLVVGGVVAWLLLRPKQRPVQATGYTLPDVAETSEDRAKRRLENECAGPRRPCVLVESRRVFKAGVPKDLTIGTEPAAGTEVEVGSKVVLLTSRGPLLVPVVANQSAADAEKLLKEICADAGCTVVVQQRIDDKVTKDLAVGTEPGEKTEIKPGATVTLLVSSGPEMRIVGKYVQMTPENAKLQIEKDGFTLGEVRSGIIRDHRPGAPPPPAIPVVYTQDPQPGESRPKGSKINLMIWLPG